MNNKRNKIHEFSDNKINLLYCVIIVCTEFLETNATLRLIRFYQFHTLAHTQIARKFTAPVHYSNDIVQHRFQAFLPITLLYKYI